MLVIGVGVRMKRRDGEYKNHSTSLGKPKKLSSGYGARSAREGREVSCHGEGRDGKGPSSCCGL